MQAVGERGSLPGQEVQITHKGGKFSVGEGFTSKAVFSESDS